MPVITEEIPSSTEVKTPEELAVGIPDDNLNHHWSGQEASWLHNETESPLRSAGHEVWMQLEREKLKEVIRYTPVSLENAWRMKSTRRMAIHTLSYRFDFSNGLSASGIWLQG